MRLIDERDAHALYAAMAPGRESSAANRMAGLVSFGGSGAFFGKVRNDQLTCAHDIRTVGVAFGSRGTMTQRSYKLLEAVGQGYSSPCITDSRTSFSMSRQIRSTV